MLRNTLKPKEPQKQKRHETKGKKNMFKKIILTKMKTHTTGSCSRLRSSTIRMFNVQSGEMSMSLQALSTSFIKASAEQRSSSVLSEA